MNIDFITKVIAIVAGVVGIIGGIVGFASTLLPLYKERVNIKVVFLKERGYFYKTETIDHDEQEVPGGYIAHPKEVCNSVIVVDVGLVNLSISDQVIYAVKLNYSADKHVRGEAYMDKKPNAHAELFDNKSHLTTEEYLELPLTIPKSGAKLASVKFTLPNVSNIHSCKLTVYCQDKPFHSELNIKSCIDL